MSRGRKPLLDPPVQWKVNVPQSLVVEIELHLVDPVTGNTRHGARSKLITKLLKDWLARQRKGGGHAI